ncbi:unnamed protein product [Spirodela intermedia]|uniref:Uncharacterized protein n=1 Tax=Spirodela intermedia TaxID=51605 RepID=A0A7I8J5X8_SPIIN|nr:unnamed protein product [Spirodela intermedia]CAA6665647.1 unnamed protein product [Spirodela intermedia]
MLTCDHQQTKKCEQEHEGLVLNLSIFIFYFCFLQGSAAYIKEHHVAVRISVATVNAIESLGELDVADVSAHSWIHHEAHSLSDGLTVVDIVIAVEVENVRSVRKDGRDSDLHHPADIP